MRNNFQRKPDRSSFAVDLEHLVGCDINEFMDVTMGAIRDLQKKEGARELAHYKFLRAQDARATEPTRRLRAFCSIEDARRPAEDLTKSIAKAQSTGPGTGGGALVNSEGISRTVIKLRDVMGVARRTCAVFKSPSDVITVPRRLTGLSTNWIGENVAIIESSMTWDAVKHTAKKSGVFNRMSAEMAEDAIGAADWITDEIAYQFAANEDNVLFNADGTSTYAGMTGLLSKLSSTSGLAGSVSAASSRTSITSFDTTDLESVCAVLPNSIRNPAWFCSRPVYHGLFCRLASQGFIPHNADGLPLWWDMPIYVTNQMPTATSSLNAKIVLLVGDMSQAVSLAARRGVTIRVSTDRYFDQDMLFSGTERFSIVVHDVGSTTAAGPIAALLGKT